MGKRKNLSGSPFTLERSARTPTVRSSRWLAARTSSWPYSPTVFAGCSDCAELMLAAWLTFWSPRAMVRPTMFVRFRSRFSYWKPADVVAWKALDAGV